jgi:hypothetical protein
MQVVFIFQYTVYCIRTVRRPTFKFRQNRDDGGRSSRIKNATSKHLRWYIREHLPYLPRLLDRLNESTVLYFKISSAYNFYVYFITRKRPYAVWIFFFSFFLFWKSYDINSQYSLFARSLSTALQSVYMYI